MRAASTSQAREPAFSPRLPACQSGYTNAPSTAVESLATPTAGSWTSLSRLFSARVGPGVASTSAGVIVYGGANGSNASSSAFNETTRHSVASMITARMQLASATDGSGLAYAIGGVGTRNTNLATAERYNASTNSWAAIASMPATRSGAAAAFDGSGAIYVVGGSATAGGTTGTNTLYKYTIATNTWSTLAPSPINVRDAAAVFGAPTAR